jgi:cytochrome P450
MATLGARRVFYVHNLHLKYGPIVRISPAEVDISDVESFRNIHRPGSGYTKTPFYATLPVNIRLGIFAMSDLKAHAVRRKLFARPFSKTFLRSNWEPVVLDRIKLSMKRIKEDADASADGEVDVMKWWLFLAGDVSTHLMFGESFHTLETGEVTIPPCYPWLAWTNVLIILSQPGIYNRVPELAIKGAAIDTQFPLLGFFAKRLPIKSFQDMYTAPATLLKFAGIALAQNKEKGTSTNIFAAVAKEVAKGEGGLLGDIDVQVEASNLIIAGSDTTGISMTFMIYNILLRPELQAALEEEVKDVSDSPLDEEMEGLPLLNAIFWESMRVHGAIPSGLPRVVPAQGANFLGYHVPAGFTVTTQAYSLHREPSVFPDPEK